ncbi:hypothetical protein T484DRAFT_1891325 [Baffinella frigidus]|nr:hypothetical protein T484DRAFT_1891325 [Cryptophyta sp. CCMP2293]
MAPSSPMNDSTRRPSHLSVIHGGIFKKARLEHSAPSSLGASHIDAWSPATGEMDDDSVERPEDMCHLSGDEWDLEDAGWRADDCIAEDEATAPPYDVQLYDTDLEVEGVWSEADCFQREERGELLELLHEDAAPSSDLDESACMSALVEW